MKIVLAIQARLESTRLPNKALLKINGLPLIDHIIKQVTVSTVNEVCLTTSEAEIDSQLTQHFSNQKLRSFRGPVDDIITRLSRAAEQTESDYLVRVWGDCPFVCADIIDSMLDYTFANNLCFLSNSEINNRSFPPGLDVEIYRSDLLKKMNLDADVSLREFPIEYIKSKLSRQDYAFFHSGNSSSLPTMNPTIHLTIDYKEDLAAAEVIFAELCPKNEVFSYENLYQFEKKNAALFGNFSQEVRNKEYKQFLKQKEKQE